MKSAFTIPCGGWRPFLLGLTLAVAAHGRAPANPALAQIRTVYLLPMANGFDQHLASRLTQTGRFQVVTDPKQADALFTDRLGEAFEVRYNELYPPPDPPAVPNDDQSGEVAAGSTSASSSEKAEAPHQERRISNFGRSKGNIFLIDRQTRNVIWSHYRRPVSTQPDQLDELADYLAQRLKKEGGIPAPSASPSAKSGTPAPTAP